MYRPPDSEIDCIDDLSETLQIIGEKVKDPIIVVGGDFNLPHINWRNLTCSNSSRERKFSQKLIDTFSLHAIEQVNMTKTRTTRAGEGNILDLLATTHPQLITNLDIVDGISDHDVIMAGVESSSD